MYMLFYVRRHIHAMFLLLSSPDIKDCFIGFLYGLLLAGTEPPLRLDSIPAFAPFFPFFLER